MGDFNIYKDIAERTQGDIYLGVVGPVRTGKSTFIKRFMDVLVLPEMEDEHARMRTQDELPQSASGRTIMTTKELRMNYHKVDQEKRFILQSLNLFQMKL